jgi:hypothetical protein
MMQRTIEARRIGVETFGAPVRRGGGWTGLSEDLPSWQDDAAPADAEDFARKAILAICEAGVSPSVGRRAYERCRRALDMGATVRMGFRHPGKADAIDRIWRDRDRLYGAYLAASDKLAALDELPWIGPVTKRALARSLGLADGQADRRSEPLRAAA